MIGSDQAQVHGHDRSFELVIRLQPVRSRMCGIGERVDRRPIDPPPIVELRPIHPDDTTIDRLNMLSPNLFLTAVLVKKEDHTNDSCVAASLDSHTSMAIGRTVSTLHLLRDLDGLEKAFFVFSDISVRAEGQYLLKMCLFEIIGSSVQFRKSILTDEFTVYSAKKFPGMYQSCQLARSFAEQGLKIRIRQESRTRKRASRHSASSSNENGTSPFEFDETSFSVGESQPLIPEAASDSIDEIQGGSQYQIPISPGEGTLRLTDIARRETRLYLSKEELGGKSPSTFVRSVAHQPHVEDAALFLDEEGNGSMSMMNRESNTHTPSRRKIANSSPENTKQTTDVSLISMQPQLLHNSGNSSKIHTVSSKQWNNVNGRIHISQRELQSSEQDPNSYGTQKVSSNTQMLIDKKTTSSKHKLALANLLHPGEALQQEGVSRNSPAKQSNRKHINSIGVHSNFGCSSAQTRAPCPTQWFLPPITQQSKAEASHYPYETDQVPHSAAVGPHLERRQTAIGMSSSGERSDRPEIILNMRPPNFSSEPSDPKPALPSLREHIRRLEDTNVGRYEEER